MNAGEEGAILAELVCQEIESQDEVGQRIMAGCVVRTLIARGWYAPPKPDALPKPQPMSSMQARAFEATWIPFGKWQAHQVRASAAAGSDESEDVPLSYLVRLADPSEWIKELRRYLANPDVQRRITKED